MKRICILVSVISLLAFAISCVQQVEPTPQFTKSSTAFTVTSSVASVNSSAKDSLTAVLSFTWSDPKFAVGLGQSMFTLVASPTGTNFANFISKSFTGALTGSLLGKEINGMALKLGGVVGKSIVLDVKIVASLGNNDEQKASNILQLTVAPYGDLGLTATSTSVTASAATSSNVADTIWWNPAFNGYSGVKKYQLQYAIGATNFASPKTVDVSSLSVTYTQLDLNKIALGLGGAPGSTVNVDFRIKATNESRDTIYSNVVTVAVATYVAYNSIGLIGDATAGGWNTDTDMYRPDPINAPSNWRLITYLKTATYAMQFRPDDAWATQWGGSGFPSGVGTPSGGNIPLTTSGYYQVDFNAGTGAYNFTLLSPTTYSTMVIAGDFNGWSTTAGPALTADATGHIWTGTVSIATAMPYGLKFVGNGSDWYGNSTFPSGFASTSGGNINPPVGNYFVYFNDVSGEFFLGNTDANANALNPYTLIGLTGDFNGWSTSSEPGLIQNPTNPYKWSAKIALTAGTAKFIDTGGAHWWGESSSGIASLTGGNIAVNTGNPQVTFNSATGEYSITY